MLPAGIVALGLVQGALAALNSLGMVLVWRSTRVINLAQPALGMVGGVLTGLLVVSAGWSFWWAAPIGIVVGALLGLASDRLVLSRLVDAPRAVLLVVTVGLAQLLGGLQTALPFVFGGTLPSYAVNLGISLDIFPVHLSGAHLLALIILPLAWLPLWWFMHRSRLGLAAMGLGQDAERARALGVSAGLVRSVVWALAGALSAASGILAVPVLGFSLGGVPGPTVILLALAPAVLTGLRSPGRAVLASLGLGVAYQAILWWTPGAGLADLVLMAAIVVAVLLQRRHWDRANAVTSVSSWAAAATPRPLPAAVAGSRRFRVAATAAALVVAVAVALPPWFLSPSAALLYATSSAFVLTAVGVGTAWMYGGEVSLGHWGLAGIGAAAALFTPGPWVGRVVVAALLVTLLGGVLAVASRARPGRSFAVLGLGMAVAAPVLVSLAPDAPSIPVPVVGAVTATSAVLAVVAVGRLRASVHGIRLVVARDEPHRSAWLGVDPRRARVVAVAMSCTMAGVAGALYASIFTTSIPPGAFDPQRSLDLLASAVVGGLGSPTGVLLGAAAMQAGQQLLPGAWTLLASGVGVIAVVMFLPAGLGRIVETARDTLVRLVVGSKVFPRSAATSVASDADESVAILPIVVGRTHIAGSDTREVMATPTVRAVALAVVCLAAPGWVAALSLSGRVTAALGVADDWAVWLTVAALAAALLVVTVARRRPLAGTDGDGASRLRLPPGWLELGLVVVAMVATAVVADAGLLAVMTAAVLLGCGWVVGRAIRVAVEASVPQVHSAALGVMTAAVITAGLPAMQLGVVTSGSGVAQGALWSLAYVVLGGAWLVAAARRLPADRRRGRLRSAGASAPGVSSPTVRSPDPTPVAAAGPAATGLSAPPSDPAPGRNGHRPQRVEDVPPLAARSVHVRFGGTDVLRGVNVDVRRGEFLALVGGNGAGKSTLLRVVAGFVRPLEGRVLVAGVDVSSLRPEERATAGLAFISGARPVFPDLTVAENLRVASYATHKTRRSHAEATTAILDLVPGLATRVKTRAGVLSGGEQRLLAVAQMLYRRPTVLMADELSLGLDTEARHGVLDLLRRLADEGVAVVAVDHDLPQLLVRADRALLLADGLATDYPDPTRILEQRSDLLPATFLAGTT